MIKQALYFFTLIVLVSCNSSKKAVTSSKNNTSYSKKNKTEIIQSTSKTVTTNEVVHQYIARYKEVAMSNMKQYGIPASIILAQGILESGAGRGTLAVNSNNHFGIKCHSDWAGESVYHDDDSPQECFRKYDNPEGSYKDHALFLTNKKRYAALFSLRKGDYEAWAKGLRAAGYATDPQYPTKLISYIERYQLHQYDNKVLGKKYAFDENQKEKESMANNASLYEVQKGDTLYSISKKFNVLVEDLQRKNNLTDNAISIGQKLIVK
jgi:flagellum-specific peptidoglycan hydrolase FlgJ